MGRPRGNSRARTAGPPPPWTPAAYSPVGRWSATDVLLSGASVTAFADIGSGGHDATQANAANQGTYAAAGNPAGGPQVAFDGSDYYKTSAFATAQPVSYIAAIKSTWTANWDVVFDGIAAPDLHMVAIDNSGVNAYLQVGVTVVNGAGLATVGAWQVLACVFDGASSSIASNAGAPITGALDAGVQGGITIGADSGAASVAEMVFYSLDMVPHALTDAERTKSNDYYHGKVGA